MLITLIVIGAIVLSLALLLLLRIRFVITLREEVVLTLSVLCFSFRLFPRKKKRVNWRDYSPKRARQLAIRQAEKKIKQAAKKAAKQAKQKPQATKEPKKGMTLPEKLGLVRALAAALFRKTGKHLRLSAARLHIRVATGDAASTAILYGAVSATLATLLALLERIMSVNAKPPQVAVIADYLAEKPSADVKLVFSMRVWGILATAFSVAIAFLRTRARQKAKQKEKKI